MMTRKKGILRITLKSDLCVASGYSYAGIVDSDVCYNENGFPYIPGRRLKGCLREAAETIGLMGLDEIFGVRGSDGAWGIQVGNAYPEGFEAVNRELTAFKAGESVYAGYLTQQKVLEQYTHVKAQTRIEEETGVAVENSLRYTRVVNQYSPLDGKPQEFLAEVEFECDEKLVSRAVKALRHMGLNRNRGLGNVECRLENVQEVGVQGVKADGSGKKTGQNDAFGPEQQVCLEYVVESVQPLLMVLGQPQQSESCIGGQTVLGALAASYLKRRGIGRKDHEAADADPVFRALFLSGETLYSNLTLCKADECDGQRIWRRYVPAPLFLNRMKKSKVLVNLAGQKDDETDGKNDWRYDPDGGNQPKKLKGKYVHMTEDGQADVKEVIRDIVYHHSRKQPSRNGEPGILYTMEVIREGQYFSGSIQGPWKYVELVKELLETYSLRLGKSKSAQYGLCRIVDMRCVPAQKPLELKAGEKVLVTLESDGIFLDGAGGYTVRYEAVKRLLAQSVGLSYVEEYEETHTYLQAGVCGGYNTMWNLQKASVPVLKAGSVVEYTVSEDCVIERTYAGERNQEGFGQVRIYREDGMKYAVSQLTAVQKQCEPEKTRGLLEQVLLEQVLDELKRKAFVPRKLMGNPAALGRVTLMLEESMNENQYRWQAPAGAGRESWQAVQDSFKKRIGSIKEEKAKKDAAALLDRCLEYSKSLEGLDAYGSLKTLFGDELDEKIRSLWGTYLMYMLIYQKYQNKIEEAAE